MRFLHPLVRGILIRRYKRFLADVVLDSGIAVTAHCANSGTMLGLSDPGSEVWLSPAPGRGRKLPFTLEMVRVDGGLVGVNTGHPNAIVAEAIAAGRIPALAGYARLRREVRYGTRSRVDLLLESDDRPPAYVEVKNVHLRRADRYDGFAAEFPDCVTARGRKHLAELSAMVAAGGRAVMVYLVQRSDCRYFRIAADLDPLYHDAFRTARAAGVEALCYACDLSTAGIDIAGALPIPEP